MIHQSRDDLAAVLDSIHSGDEVRFHYNARVGIYSITGPCLVNREDKVFYVGGRYLLSDKKVSIIGRPEKVDRTSVLVAEILRTKAEVETELNMIDERSS